MNAIVTAVSRAKGHSFSKRNEPTIRLAAGLGVEGDAHQGEKVKHRYHAARDPDAPNLRQVHLIHEELFAELRDGGFDVPPGALGENVTTRGVDLLSLPRGARLRFGDGGALIEVTGLRSPCRQIDKFQPGLMNAMLGKDDQGRVIRKSGVMAVVIAGGDIRAGDTISVEWPAGERLALEPV